MISLIHYEDQSDIITKTHKEFTNMKLIDALTKKFGTIPSMDEIAKHVLQVVEEATGVSHYVWVDRKPEIGESIDMSCILCSIEPPNLTPPHQ